MIIHPERRRGNVADAFDTGLPMNAPPLFAFRLGMLLFALLLGLYSVWLLLAELSRPGIDRLPTDAVAAAVAAKQRGDATWAAYIGAIRGDLWAESAFTYADLLWSPAGADRDHTQALEQALIRLDRTLEHAPLKSGAWLLLAGLASHYSLPDVRALEALKMSYYTGSNEQDLASLRLRIAAHFQDLSDGELQRSVGHDLRLLLARHQNGAVVEAYADASPVGKRLIETTVRGIDPSVLKSLHLVLPD